MNPETLSLEALSLFNSLNAEGRREATLLAETLPEEEAVYIAALRQMPADKRRRFLFELSRQRWRL